MACRPLDRCSTCRRSSRRSARRPSVSWLSAEVAVSRRKWRLAAKRTSRFDPRDKQTSDATTPEKHLVLQHEWIKGPWSWCGKAAFSSLSLISYSSTSVVVPLWKLEAVKSPRCTHCTLPGHRELASGSAAYCSRCTWTFVLLGSSFGLILGPRCRGSQFDPLPGTSSSSEGRVARARRATRSEPCASWATPCTTFFWFPRTNNSTG